MMEWYKNSAYLLKSLIYKKKPRRKLQVTNVSDSVIKKILVVKNEIKHGKTIPGSYHIETLPRQTIVSSLPCLFFSFVILKP